MRRQDITAAKVAARADIAVLVATINKVAADPKVPQRLLTGGFVQDVNEFFHGLDRVKNGIRTPLQSGSLAELEARKARLEKIVKAIT